MDQHLGGKCLIHNTKRRREKSVAEPGTPL